MVWGEDTQKMTFVTIYGHYEFLVMSIGITYSPEESMDLMNRVYWSYQDSFVIVFIYDIFVYSKNEGEHKDQLRMVLQFLKEN